MTRPFDPESIFFGENCGPSEPLVQIYMERIRNGESLAMPLLVRQPNGRYRPLHSEDASKVEAAHRCGIRIDATVIDDPGPEKLDELRRVLRRGPLSSG
jgi:hypothetical protein